MALTKISRELLNTGVADSSDATFLTVDSSEAATFAGNDTFPILQTIGPSFIICLGLYLLYRALKEVRHEHDEDCDEPMHFHFNESKYSSRPHQEIGRAHV